jgi:hypothetical protein
MSTKASTRASEEYWGLAWTWDPAVKPVRAAVASWASLPLIVIPSDIHWAAQSSWWLVRRCFLKVLTAVLMLYEYTLLVLLVSPVELQFVSLHFKGKKIITYGYSLHLLVLFSLLSSKKVYTSVAMWAFLLPAGPEACLLAHSCRWLGEGGRGSIGGLIEGAWGIGWIGGSDSESDKAEEMAERLKVSASREGPWGAIKGSSLSRWWRKAVFSKSVTMGLKVTCRGWEGWGGEDDGTSEDTGPNK